MPMRSHPADQPQGRYRPEVNQLFFQDRSAHDWYRFILSFPPHLVRDYLQRFGITPQHRVLDPFCGTGTTLVECKKLGIPSVGVEANPMAHFASQVKLDWSPDPDGLLTHAATVAAAVRSEFMATCIDDSGLNDGLPLFQQPSPDASSLHTLDPEQLRLLLKNSISPLPLHKTLVLLHYLEQYRDDRYDAHERLALAKALVSAIGNVHFSPEVSVGRAKKLDAPVVDSWLAAVRVIAEDLRQLRSHAGGPALVYHADSRELRQVLLPTSIDAVITSPPYPNEKDYTRTTRLESVLLGFIRSRADLRTLKQGLLRSNSRGVYTLDNDDQWVANNLDVQHLAAEIESRRTELGKTSGFERVYAKVTKLYFGGMARHLAELRSILRPGAQLAYVVGDQASFFRIPIRTGVLLAQIAHQLNYDVIDIELFRTRTATVTGTQLREEVVLLRWRG